MRVSAEKGCSAETIELLSNDSTEHYGARPPLETVSLFIIEWDEE